MRISPAAQITFSSSEQEADFFKIYFCYLKLINHQFLFGVNET